MSNSTGLLKWLMAGRTGMSASLQTLATKVLTLVVNIATGMITARALAETGRGEQAAMLLWPGLIASFVLLGLPSALLYKGKQNPEKRKEFFSGSLILSIGFGVVAIIIGIIGIPYWMSSYSPAIIHASQLLMLMAPLGILSNILQSAFQLEGRFDFYNQSSYAMPFCTLIALLSLLWSGNLSPITACLAYTLPSIPVSLWMLQKCLSLIGFTWPSWKSSFRPLLTYGLRYYGMDILGRISMQIDQALVISLLSPAQMGLYSIALSLSRMLTIFHSSISSVLVPKTTALPIHEVILLTGKTTRICTVITAASALGVALVSKPILWILYGENFVSASNTLQVLLLEVVIGTAAWMLAQAFLAIGKPETITAFQFFGLMLGVPCMLVLIPKYGILGASLSILVSTIARLIFIQLSFWMVLKVRPPGLIPRLSDFIFLRKALQRA